MSDRSRSRRKGKGKTIPHHIDIHVENPARPTRLFELPIRPQQPRKRKRRQDSDSDEEDKDSDHSGQAPASPPGRSSSSDEDVEPPPDFPHAPLYRAFDLPDFVSGAIPPKAQRNIKHQHFAVLNTILNRSLLEHDFARASRAFGLLLRFEFNGQKIDLRKKALWGTGAEILLHRRPDGSFGLDPDGWYSDEGFEQAKKYYERLILQYPWRRTRPDDVCASTFYPAMLGLWIMQVQARDRRKQKIIDDDVSEDEDSDDSESEDEREEINERRMKAKEEIIKQAREIADRIENVTSLPPFDEDVRLVRLKGLVAVWISCLRRQAGMEQTEEDETGAALRRTARHAFRFVLEQGIDIHKSTLRAAEEWVVDENEADVMDFRNAEY